MSTDPIQVPPDRRARLIKIAKLVATVLLPLLIGVGGGTQMGSPKTIEVEKRVEVPQPQPIGADEHAAPINYEGSRYHGGHDHNHPENVESNGVRWPTKQLPYWVDYSTVSQLRPAVTNDAVSGAFKQAWNWWAEALDIEPQEVADRSQALVTIRFERMDGPNGVLAESYLADGTLRPKSQRYDASERWTVGPPANGLLSLPTVACHELGHVLGLGHDDPTAPAVMRPVYSASLPREQVRDIDRMVQLGYARRAKAPPAPTDVLSFPVQVKTDDVVNALLKAGYTVTKP